MLFNWFVRTGEELWFCSSHDTKQIVDAIKQVNSTELPERKPANLQKVQETFSVSSTANLADEVKNFSISYAQIKEDEKHVEQNRMDLNRSKQGPSQEVQLPIHTFDRGYQNA